MKNVLIFVLGAAAGSLATWKVVKDYYKKLADEEIESVVEKFTDREIRKQNVVKLEVNQHKHYSNVTDEDIREGAELLNGLGYTPDELEEVFDNLNTKVAPFIISPEEYGEKDGYDVKSWTYYADKVLTDEQDDIVFEPEFIIGDVLSHFGEYDDDAIHVRNETTQCDYEIIRCDSTYSELGGEDFS